MNKRYHFTLSFTSLVVAVMLGGCVGGEPVEGDEAQGAEGADSIGASESSDDSEEDVAGGNSLSLEEGQTGEDVQSLTQGASNEVQSDALAREEKTSDVSIESASTSAIVYMDGTRAAEAWFNRGAPAFIDLYDAKCDAHSVYVLYKINGGSQTRRSLTAGCGTSARFWLFSGAFNIQYRVCVDKQLGIDPCSGWVNDHN